MPIGFTGIPINDAHLTLKGTLRRMSASNFPVNTKLVTVLLGTILAALSVFGQRNETAKDKKDIAAGAQGGSVCVAPVPKKPTPYAATPGFFCPSEKLALRIDTLQERSWPINESVKIDGLGVTIGHRVVIFCDGKPQQSFKFRFSDYKTRQLCLFINDLYKTAQLWESKQSPWCKCR